MATNSSKRQALFVGIVLGISLLTFNLYQSHRDLGIEFKSFVVPEAQGRTPIAALNAKIVNEAVEKFQQTLNHDITSSLNDQVRDRASGVYFLTSTSEWSLDPIDAPDRIGLRFAGHKISPVGYRQCQRDTAHTFGELDKVWFIVPDDSDHSIPDFERLKNYNDFIITPKAYRFEGFVTALQEFVKGHSEARWMAVGPADVLLDWNRIDEALFELTRSRVKVDILGLNVWGDEQTYPGLATIWSSDSVTAALSILEASPIDNVEDLVKEVLRNHPHFGYRAIEGSALGPFIDPDRLCQLSINIDPFYLPLTEYQLTWDKKILKWDPDQGDPYKEAVEYLYSRHEVENVRPDWLLLPKTHKGSPYGTYLIHSNPTGSSRRKLLRRHYDWQGLKGRYAFILGKPKDDQWAAIKEEAEEFDDLVIADFDDNYLHIMVKFFTLASYYKEFCQKSISNPSGSPMLIKLDHDVLFWWKGQFGLVGGKPDPTYASDVNCLVQLYHDNEPVRCNSCSYSITRRQWPFQSYPDYCVGPQFSLNNDGFDKIYERMRTTEWGQSPWIPTVGRTCMDDVIATGLFRAMDNVKIGWGSLYGRHMNKFTDDEFEYAMVQYHKEIEANPPKIYEF